VQSWVNISTDPIQGNDQKSTTFWEKITSNYNKYREASYPLRTIVQAKARFQKLSKTVQVFVGCYKSVTNPPKSGHSEADIVDEALALYLSITKTKFKSVKVWRVLKEEPKWRGAAMATCSRRQKNSVDGAYSSPSNPSTPIDCSEYEAPQPSVRPPGQKAAKRNAKSKVANQPSNNDDLAVAEAIAKDRTDAMKVANLVKCHEILTKDTSHMTEEQLMGHKFICARIMRDIG
jgi:hypothetical protein